MTAQRIEQLSDDVTLYLGDCREIVKGMGGGMAIVSDPPYGIGYQRGAGGRGKQDPARRRVYGAIIGDDVPFEPEPWLCFPEVILWGANHFAARLPHGRWLAWNKLADMQPWDNFSDVEFAWQNMRAADRIFSLLWKGLVQGEKAAGGLRCHPTQKPVALMRWCLEQLRSSDLTICDPYMGSGTTGVACVQLGRKFIGIELEPKYFDIACRRIGDELKRPRLPLDAPVAEPKQEGLPL